MNVSTFERIVIITAIVASLVSSVAHGQRARIASREEKYTTASMRELQADLWTGISVTLAAIYMVAT